MDNASVNGAGHIGGIGRPHQPAGLPIDHRLKTAAMGCGNDRFAHSHRLGGRPAERLRFTGGSGNDDIRQKIGGRHIGAMPNQFHPFGKTVLLDQPPQFPDKSRIFTSITDENGLKIQIAAAN